MSWQPGRSVMDDPARTKCIDRPVRIDRMIDNIASAPAHSLKFGLWSDLLLNSPSGEGALLFDRCARRARTENSALAAYLVLADFPTLVEKVGPGRMAEILHSARELELHAAVLLLEHHGERNAPDKMGPPPDPIADSMSLGHRKTVARGPRSPILERLMKDPDPRIVEQTLRNPRLREEEVVAIASRRPCPEEVFWNIASADRWITRAPLRRAIVLNPYAPLRLAITLLVTLTDVELSELKNEKRLHPSIRYAASEIPGW